LGVESAEAIAVAAGAAVDGCRRGGGVGVGVGGDAGPANNPGRDGAGGVAVTRYVWTVTVDGVEHSGCWPGVSATEVADMVATEARLLCGPQASIHVRAVVRVSGSE
jgi:hypothetical protein